MKSERRLSVCPACGGSGIRPPDGEDSMGLPRWGPEGMDNRVDRRCRTCRRSEDSTDRTPPLICAAASDPSEALIAFIGQELERWGFEIKVVEDDYAVRVSLDGEPYYVEVTPL